MFVRLYVLLFKQKTAYELRISDWSSDVCSSDLLQPGNVDIVLINDSSINAFVAGGQAVYIHSGLINAADNAIEVQGVIAHELGHITGGHIVQIGRASGRERVCQYV